MSRAERAEADTRRLDRLSNHAEVFAIGRMPSGAWSVFGRHVSHDSHDSLRAAIDAFIAAEVIVADDLDGGQR